MTPFDYQDPILWGLLVVALATTYIMYRKTTKWNSETWRNIIIRAPVPMLGLAAAFGVYEFGLIFYPGWVAALSAASFEVVYISLGWQILQTDEQKEEARRVAFFAVAVSIIYNSLVGLFHLSGMDVRGLPFVAQAALALVHGIPLAVVAYNYSKLVLHGNTPSVTVDSKPSELVTQDQLMELLTRLISSGKIPPANRTLPLDDALMWPVINTLKNQGKSPTEVALMLGPGWDKDRVKKVLSNGQPNLPPPAP